MILHNALRISRLHSPVLFAGRHTCASSTSPARRRRISSLLCGPTEQAPEMETAKEQNSAPPVEVTGDVMADSFGQGYSTRSDEEGFGGIYGGNQTLPGDEEDVMPKSKTEIKYDVTQGSEVKEKEKGRNQQDIRI